FLGRHRCADLADGVVTALRSRRVTDRPSCLPRGTAACRQSFSPVVNVRRATHPPTRERQDGFPSWCWGGASVVRRIRQHRRSRRRFELPEPHRQAAPRWRCPAPPRSLPQRTEPVPGPPSALAPPVPCP